MLTDIIVLKFYRLSASSLLLIALAVPTCGDAVTITGTVRMEGGGAIRAGTLIFTDLERRSGKMPVPHILTRVVTDSNGRFKVDLDPRGDLDIELIDDHCSWRGGYKIVRKEELKSAKALVVDIEAIQDECH